MEKNKAKSIVQFIDEHVLTDRNSFDISDIVDRLPENAEEAAGEFCDRLELGNWFYEALILNDIDISEELIEIGARRAQEEQEAAKEREEIDRDMRAAQGWPI